MSFVVSLSNAGGGIGPHTDDYDVFLIQMAGERRWDIGKRIISTREEMDGLQDGLDVRILSFWDEEVKNGLVETFVLEPGKCKKCTTINIDIGICKHQIERFLPRLIF